MKPAQQLFTLACAAGIGACGAFQRGPRAPLPPAVELTAPDSFDVEMVTTKGTLVLRAYRAWSPLGVDRFYTLVRRDFFDSVAFHRTINRFVAQFGIHGDTAVSRAWRERTIRDDPVRARNERGTLAFARGGPNTRGTQLFFNLVDNTPRLDTLNGFGFPPIARVVRGLHVLDSLNWEYSGTRGGRTFPGPSQDSISRHGNAYLARHFPRLDYILRARVLRGFVSTDAGVPARRTGAMTGSEFIAAVADLSRDAREAAVLRELMAGNIPDFLRALRPVSVRADTGGSTATLVFEVMPDYLAIGADNDYVRMPMTPATAQAFGDAFGFVLPTRKMANDIWRAAEVRLEPRPLTEERESVRTFLQHHRIIEDQLAGRRGAFVAGIKKDVVITNLLRERPDRVAIYGWHHPDGRPIQPLYAGHVDWYVDYSHGVRPVRSVMRLNGSAVRFADVVAGEHFALVSDEGPITSPRYGPR